MFLLKIKYNKSQFNINDYHYQRRADNIMKNITVGILAHVDAGKTTLSEGMLYLNGEIRKLGEWTTRTPFWIPMN